MKCQDKIYINKVIVKYTKVPTIMLLLRMGILIWNLSKIGSVLKKCFKVFGCVIARNEAIPTN